MAEEDLGRQSSGGSDETNDYPEGLPGTTPPDDNRFMKRMKAMDRKICHGRKSSPNDSKRRETREGGQPYGSFSPIREGDVAEQVSPTERHDRVEEAGSGADSTRTEHPPHRAGSDKALKRHASVAVSTWEGHAEEGVEKMSANRRSTMPFTSVGRAHWKDKEKRRSRGREGKHRPFEADTGGDTVAVEDTPLNAFSAGGEERLKKSGSVGDSVHHSSEDEGKEGEAVSDKWGTQRSKFSRTRRSTVGDTRLEVHHTLQEVEQKRRRGRYAHRQGKVKEWDDFYDNLKLALLQYGIGAASKRRQVSSATQSRQYNRHASEGSVRGSLLVGQLWVHLNRYLEGYNEEDLLLYQSHLVARRLEVCKLLSKVLRFQLPLLQPQDSTYEFGPEGVAGTGEYTEIPSSDDPTPHMSLEVSHEVVTSQEGDCPAASSLTHLQGEVSVNHQRPVPPSSLGDDATSSLTPSAIHRLQMSKGSKPSSFDEVPPSFSPESFLEKRQLLALQRVTSLLDELEKVERLYPTTKALGDENPEYRRPNFCRKVEALELWCKITNGLACRLCDLSMWFGTRICESDDLYSVERTFSNDSGTPSSSSSAHTPTVQPTSALPSSLVLSPDDRRQVVSSPAGSGKQSIKVVRVGPYHRFVVRALKKGIKRMLDSITAHNHGVLKLCLHALAGGLSRQSWAEEDEGEREERVPIYPSQHSSVPERGAEWEGHNENWLAEFDKMNLPMFHDQFLLLARVRLDVIHECLRLQLYLRPPKRPSEFSISRLVTECRDTLEWALRVREEFAEMIEQAMQGSVVLSGRLNAVCEAFETDLGDVFNLYLDYLQDWVKMSSAYNVLPAEWTTAKALSRKMNGREAKAARRFCLMTSQMMWQFNEVMLQGMDQLVAQLNAMEPTSDYNARRNMVEMARLFKNLFTDSKEKSSKLLGFAKTLLKDLEVAADLHIAVSHKDLLQCLYDSHHAQVAIAGRMDRGKMMFVPFELAKAVDNKEGIAELLTLAFGRDDFLQRYPQFSNIREHLYILIVNVDHEAPQGVWSGEVIHVETSIEATITSMELEVEGMKMVVSKSSQVDYCRHLVHKALGRAVKDKELHTSTHQEVTQCLKDIRERAITVCETTLQLYDEVQRHWTNVWEQPESEEADASAYHSQMIQACFNLGFENVRETIRLLGENMAYKKLGQCILDFTIKWMDFIIQKCRKGRGARPRWATSGLDFLMVGCHPKVLSSLNREEFVATKQKVNQCLSHMVGENPQKPPPRRRDHGPFLHGSPLPLRRRCIEFDMLGTSLPSRSLSDRPLMEEEDGRKWLAGSTGSLHPPVARLEEDYRNNFPPLVGVANKTPPSTDSSASTSSGVVKDSPPVSGCYDDAMLAMSFLPTDMPYRSASVNLGSSYGSYICGDAPDGVCRLDRIRRAAAECDQKRDRKLKDNSVIGRPRERGTCAADTMRLSALKQSEFTWIRGRLLGKGASGKVYQALNVKSGETMAVKQISIQENNQRVDHQRIIDEIANLQKLKHSNIIRYYGVEVHRSELFLFMEYCPEGNVWLLAQQGLHEALVRMYTCQILHGVNAIHENGIVHRDIKGANVFVTSNGRLKLGDFGLSFQLRNTSHSVLDGIADNVGTVPYMAPEVIRSGKTHHIGRASDIWSVGCTVIEMITGKIPWAEYDNHMRIMLAVGNGSAPQIPDSLGEEGHEFLKFCFEIEPSKRWSASQLLNHAFVKVGQGEWAESES